MFDVDPALSLGAAALAALVAGLTGSLHCFVMCGPLACATMPGREQAGRGKAIAAYHSSRVLAYTLVGGGLGALGGGLANALAVSTRPVLPWLMAAALALPALGLDKRIGRIPLLGSAAARVARFAAKFSSTTRAAAIGAVTPLLPCGLLYGIFIAALSSGSFVDGAVVLGAFAFGAVPALFAAQLQVGLFDRLPSRAQFVMRRVVPLAAAAVMVWRGLSTPNSCH